MQFQSITDKSTADIVLRAIQNAITGTTTATAATIAKGSPVVLATSSASNNGIFVSPPDTAGANLLNNLFCGIVYDYPDTTASRTGTFQAEAVGRAQVYGVATNAVLLQNATASIAPGVILVPNTGTTLITAVGPVTAAGTSTSAHTELTGIGGLAVLLGSVATNATTTATVAATVFLRCM